MVVFVYKIHYQAFKVSWSGYLAIFNPLGYRINTLPAFGRRLLAWAIKNPPVAERLEGFCELLFSRLLHQLNIYAHQIFKLF